MANSSGSHKPGDCYGTGSPVKHIVLDVDSLEKEATDGVVVKRLKGVDGRAKQLEGGPIPINKAKSITDILKGEIKVTTEKINDIIDNTWIVGDNAREKMKNRVADHLEFMRDRIQFEYNDAVSDLDVD